MFSIDYKVAISDTGADGSMRVSNLLELIGDCEQFQIDSATEFTNYCRKNNVGVFLSFRQADIVRLPRYSENIKAVTYVYETGRLFGYRNTFIYGENGETLLKTYAVGPFIDLAENTLHKLPQEIADSITADTKRDMEYTPRKIILPEMAPVISEPIKVLKSFIDIYHHTNNVRYVSAAMEYLPKDFNFFRIRAEYRNPAVLGSLLHPQIYIRTNKAAVSLTDGNGSPYAVVEFS